MIGLSARGGQPDGRARDMLVAEALMPLRLVQCAARSCTPQLARMMTPDRT